MKEAYVTGASSEIDILFLMVNCLKTVSIGHYLDQSHRKLNRIVTMHSCAQNEADQSFSALVYILVTFLNLLVFFFSLFLVESCALVTFFRLCMD